MKGEELQREQPFASWLKCYGCTWVSVLKWMKMQVFNSVHGIDFFRSHIYLYNSNIYINRTKFKLKKNLNSEKMLAKQKTPFANQHFAETEMFSFHKAAFPGAEADTGDRRAARRCLSTGPTPVRPWRGAQCL